MSAHKPGDPTTLNRLYGRSVGHKLRPAQQALVDTLLPQIAVPAEGQVTARRLFNDDRPLHLEIGFGSGEHLAFRADLLPDHGFIGAEPFVNGVATTLGHIRDSGLANVRLHMGDALEVLRRLPDGALRFVYLLHPDPWPKARHAKRRMASDGPSTVAAKLEPGASCASPPTTRLSRMDADGHAAPRPSVRMAGRKTADFLAPPVGWIETRYGAKSAARAADLIISANRRPAPPQQPPPSSSK